jgi:hypothetical protein
MVTGIEDGRGLRCIACFEEEARLAGVQLAWLVYDGFQQYDAAFGVEA